MLVKKLISFKSHSEAGSGRSMLLIYLGEGLEMEEWISNSYVVNISSIIKHKKYLN